MRMEVRRYGIAIIPENESDEAYIEEVLGMRGAGSQAVCIREDAIGLSRIAHIAIHKKE